MPRPAKHKKYPKSSSQMIVKNLVLAMAVIEPIMTGPQIYEIWVKRQTAGVSLITWSFYLFSAFIWLLYGFQIKDKPVIIASALWVAMESAVVLGLIIY